MKKIFSITVTISLVCAYSAFAAAQAPSCINDPNSIHEEEFSSGITYDKVTCPDGTKFLIQKKFTKNATKLYQPSANKNIQNKAIEPKEIFPNETVTLGSTVESSLNEYKEKSLTKTGHASDNLKIPETEIKLSTDPLSQDIQSQLDENFGKGKKNK